MRRRKLYLITYDIREPARLIRVHRIVRNYGLPVQYSVFAAELDRRELAALMAELQDTVDERVDDVRAYPLPQPPVWHNYGRAAMPKGAQLLGLL